MIIILIGMKGCGKTTIGTLLAEKLHIPFMDADTQVECIHKQETGEALAYRQIFKHYGEEYFQALDTRALKHIAEEAGKRDFVFACGGRTPLREENQEMLLKMGKIVFLNVKESVLLKRILMQGIPAFFPYQNDPERSLTELCAERLPIYKKLATLTQAIGEEASEAIVDAISRGLRDDEKNQR